MPNADYIRVIAKRAEIAASREKEADAIAESLEKKFPRLKLTWATSFGGGEEITSSNSITEELLLKVGEQVNEILHPMGYKLKDTSTKFGYSVDWTKGKVT